jgi:hypothetical protein
MTELARYMNEMVCGHCGHTGHVTFEGAGDERRIAEATVQVRQDFNGKPAFACAHCDKALQAV